MHRFAIFVDGSNLVGTLRRMNLRVDNYEPLYRYVFDHAVRAWRANIDSTTPPPAQLFRVYWYGLGSMDDWDLSDARAQATMRDLFERDADTKRGYMAMAGQKLPGRPQEEVATEAWAMCFNDVRDWCKARHELIEGFRRFHHALRTGTDFIEVIECGRWKVDLLRRSVTEKGLDTRMAVDIVTKCSDYDGALLISGDADNIPSLNHVRAAGKQVGAVEFLAGYPPDKKGSTFSSKLRVAVDFVVQVYEMDMVGRGMAKKGTGALSTPQSQPAG